MYRKPPHSPTVNNTPTGKRRTLAAINADLEAARAQAAGFVAACAIAACFVAVGLVSLEARLAAHAPVVVASVGVGR